MRDDALIHARTWLRALQVRATPRTGAIAGGRLVLLGVRGEMLVAIVPVVGLWAVFLHADLPWRLGPLRYVIATPLFHRWHHALDREGHDRNFAGLFPIWDLVIGTFYLPAFPPRACGVQDAVPDGFMAQMLYPFRRQAGARRAMVAKRAPRADGEHV